MKYLCSIFLTLATIMFILPGEIMADNLEYRTPSEKLKKIINRKRPELVSRSPKGDYLLTGDRITYPAIKEIAKETIPLAGIVINPDTQREQRWSFFNSFSIINTSTAEKKTIKLPKNLNFDFPLWSPDGKHFALVADTKMGQELWIGETSTANIKRTKIYLSSILNYAFDWKDSETLILREVSNGVIPQKPSVPQSPVVKESYGKAKQSVTYQNLLKDKYGEELFDYYCKTTISLFNINTFKKTTVTKPSLYIQADVSPDGKYMLTQRIERPFSYNVTYFSFPRIIEIIDMEGNVIKTLAKRPLLENIPFESVPEGPRNVMWSPDKPSRLIWVQALDGGNTLAEAQFRDRILFSDAPFNSEPITITDLKDRFKNLLFFQKTNKAILTTSDRKRRWETRYLLEETQNSTLKEISGRNIKDIYNDPGDIETFKDENGQRFILTEDNCIFLKAPGATPEGHYPYLAKFNIETKENKIIYKCGEGRYDRVFAVLPNKKIILQKESPTEPSNYFIKNLKDGNEKQLTFFSDELRGLITRELVEYKRSDGTKLSGILYLPANWKDGDKPLPLLIWAYPLEYTDSKVAGQLRDSKFRYPIISGDSSIIYATCGYAVLYNAAIPIVGEPDTKNNTFIEQINSSAKAAIDYLDERKIADPKRVAVSGHSYGAFMTANLLAHSNLFKAGIARSGAYNRTLTPFGFQDERRTFWEARDVYINMSPFSYADKIKTPLLLIHGMNDSNTGTYPMQSERLFDAVKGNGGDIKLVMLPLEDHGYRAIESVLHVTAETIEWLDKYLKQPEDNNNSQE